MAWIELFTTDIGLLSLFTIGFIIAMAAYIVHFVGQHAAEDAGAAGRRNQGAHPL